MNSTGSTFTLHDPIRDALIVATISDRMGSIWPATLTTVIDGERWQVPCSVDEGVVVTPSDWQTGPWDWEDDSSTLRTHFTIIDESGRG